MALTPIAASQCHADGYRQYRSSGRTGVRHQISCSSLFMLWHLYPVQVRKNNIFQATQYLPPFSLRCDVRWPIYPRQFYLRWSSPAIAHPKRKPSACRRHHPCFNSTLVKVSKDNTHADISKLSPCTSQKTTRYRGATAIEAVAMVRTLV
jgi:hypothetical protein